MVGSKTSGNPYSIPINYDREIGEPIIFIIRKKGFGKGTYAGMVLMQNLKDEIFAYWKDKGEDPQVLWDKWFPKWSMMEAEQKEMRNKEAKEAHNLLVNQYVGLGELKENAENLASLFPDSNPLDVLRGKNYNTQNKPIGQKLETIENKQEKTEHQKALMNEKQSLETTLKQYERTPEFRVRLHRIAEIERELSEEQPQQQAEQQQQPHP